MSQSLIEFFSMKKNRNLRTAKRTLLLAIAELEKHQDVIKDLCAATIRIGGESGQPNVSFSPIRRAAQGPPVTRLVSRDQLTVAEEPPLLRPAEYEPPEVDSAPWVRNQYSLGVAFHEALSRQLFSQSTPGQSAGAPAVILPIEEFIPSFKGGFSIALKRMTAEDPERRFKDARDAIRFVRGIGEGTVRKVLFALILAFFLVVCSAVAYFAWPDQWTLGNLRGRHGDNNNAGPQGAPPPGMAAISGGTVDIDGAAKQVAPFNLDKYAVTIGKYEAYARTKGRKMPFGDNADYSRDFPDHPVWNVSWQDAAAYCADNGGNRLPTEAEWKRAVDTAGYPWGRGTPAPGQANVESNALAEVGATADDKTSGGIFDLMGNIPEWMQDDFGDGRKVVRGGAYYLPASFAAERLAVAPDLSAEKGYLRVGFRCAHN